MDRTHESGSGNRGCGSRKAGGVYLCTKLGNGGIPIEDFLVDPVVPFAGEPFRAPILIADPDDPEVQHAVVWVGAEFYPSLVDFFEESSRKGVSRRVPSGFNFKALTPGKSKMIFVHPKAFTESLGEPESCPKDIPEHGKEEPCIGMHWHYAKAVGSAVEGTQATVGDIHYPVPEQVPAPEDLSPGIFFALPINAVEYEAKDESDMGPESLLQADDLGFPVTIIDRDRGDE